MVQLAKSHFQWMSECSISQNSVKEAHTCTVEALCHVTCQIFLNTPIVCVWHCAARCIEIHRWVRHSAGKSQSGERNTHMRRIHTAVRKCHELVGKRVKGTLVCRCQMRDSVTVSIEKIVGSLAASSVHFLPSHFTL